MAVLLVGVEMAAKTEADIKEVEAKVVEMLGALREVLTVVVRAVVERAVGPLVVDTSVEVAWAEAAMGTEAR